MTRKRRRLRGRAIGVLAIMLLTLVPLSRAAQDEGAGVHMLAGEVELTRLIDLCAERLGLRIEYDARVFQGATVTLRVRDGITDDELWLATNQILYARGFAAIQTAESDLISIAKVTGADALARVEDRVEGAQAGYVSVLFELKHRDPKEVNDALRPLMSKAGGSITLLGKTNLLLISDYRPRVQEAIKLVERIDVPPEEATIEAVTVNYLPANQLNSLITAAANAYGSVAGQQLTGKLIPAPDGSALVLVAPVAEVPRWRAMIDRFDRREALQTRTYSPRHFGVEEVARLIGEVGRDRTPRGSGDQWRMVTDRLTGTLIVTATPSEHDEINALIDRLDSVPQASRRPVRAFPIRNRSVNEILDVLQRLVEAGVLEAATLEPAAASDAATSERSTTGRPTEREVLPPGAVPVEPPGVRRGTTREQSPRMNPARSGRTGNQDQPLTLTADEGTNTLIAVGEARRLDQLGDLIQTLDVRQPQVMLEVLIVNLTDGQSFDLGVELEKLEISGSTLINLASLFDLGAPGVEEVETPSGAGGTALVLSPGDFRILVRTPETISDGRALNIPKVLVSNNREATFTSVLQEPFTSTNASTTVATTSFGGTQDAGTAVTVRPQIAEGDHLVLEYSVSLSVFVGESSSPALPPPRQENNLSSVVTIPDGHTVVIGGLETIREAEAISQVPVLGWIPLLGEAFKSRSTSSSRSRFYVFIQANVLRRDRFEDLKFYSEADIAAAEVDDGWPEVIPRVIR